MSITPEERRLIDAAIAEGRVQHIPTGKSADAFEVEWDSKQSKLRYVDSKAASRRAVGRYNTPKRGERV